MYSVGVIGLGKIAAMYGKPEDTAPYCHVGGIRHSERVALKAVCDISAPVTEAFRERWGGCFPDLRYHDSFAKMWAADAPDVIAVCVRGPDHFDVMMEVIEAGPRAIFLEKPPTCSLEQMDAMVAAAKAKGIPITVSSMRTGRRGGTRRRMSARSLTPPLAPANVGAARPIGVRSHWAKGQDQ